MPSMATNPISVTYKAEVLSEVGGRRWFRSGWLVYYALAVLYGAYQGFNALIGLRSAGSDIASWKPLLWEWSSIFVIVPLIPLIARFEEHFRVDGRPRGRAIFPHLVGAVVFSIVHVTGMISLRKLVYAIAGESYDFGGIWVREFYELQKDLITYAVILIVIFALREVRVRRAGELRAAELASELSQARLQHLTAQIEPHFLFNTLNAISNRMHEDVNAADRMISQLGDLLRAAYESDKRVMVPLSRELGWLRGYTTMMTERFRGQIVCEIEIEPNLEEIEVPRLLMQPIVENAFKHGLGDSHGRLWIDVRLKDSRLHYTISDDGVGMPEQVVQQGTGLSNITRRLELLFRSDYSMTCRAREPRGTVVTVSFPVTR
jgi:two-component system LytT family sensor kinase